MGKGNVDALAKDRLAALAVDCFRNQPLPSYRCSQNGPPVSPFDYLICKFRQGSLVDETGHVGRDGASDARSKAKTASLEAVLELMLDDILNTPLKSVGDVSTKWADQLLKFNVSGVSANQFVMQTLANCFKKAEHEVRRELRDPSTELGR